MILTKRDNYPNNGYVCELTEELDKRLNISHECKDFKTYLTCPVNNTYLIRIPGRTIGSVELDDDNEICNISINSVLIGDSETCILDLFKTREDLKFLSRFLGQRMECE